VRRLRHGNDKFSDCLLRALSLGLEDALFGFSLEIGVVVDFGVKSHEAHLANP
jgi:hypothetical protein